ncbi:MAG: hypothetical protein IJT43_09385 [Stomatobaculum sp.]|nr:hypothetical protein [Stomatobaculum sp.]
MIKKKGAILAVIAVMMFSTTAYAEEFVDGYHLAITDDGEGHVNAWNEDDYPVEVDLDKSGAHVRIHNGEESATFDFDRRTDSGQYISDKGDTLDIYDCNNLRMTTSCGIGYITR